MLKSKYNHQPQFTIDSPPPLALPRSGEQGDERVFVLLLPTQQLTETLLSPEYRCEPPLGPHVTSIIFFSCRQTQTSLSYHPNICDNKEHSKSCMCEEFHGHVFT